MERLQYIFNSVFTAIIFINAQKMNDKKKVKREEIILIIYLIVNFKQKFDYVIYYI